MLNDFTFFINVLTEFCPNIILFIEIYQKARTMDYRRRPPENMNPRNGKYPPQPPRREPHGDSHDHGEKPNKYIKNRQQPPVNQPKKQQRHKAQPSGAKRYNEYLQREKQRERFQQKAEQKKPYEKAKTQDAETKGTLPSQDLETPLEDKDNLYLAAQGEKTKAEKKADIIRKILVFVSCFVFSFVLSIFSFRIPLTPSHVTIEFSAFGELLAALCIHPLAGVAVIFLKNGIYLLFTSNVPNIANKTILDMLFVLLTSFVFYRTLNSNFILKKLEYRNLNDLPKKDYSISCILFAGAISCIITALASVLTTQYILLPLLYRFYVDKGATYNMILMDYQRAFEGLTRYVPIVKKIFPEMNNLKTGLILYNFPLNVFKFFVCTVATAFVYPILNNFTNRD